MAEPNPHVEGMGAITPMAYQKEAVQRAIMQLRPRLLLADAVGFGKTIEVGMILSELMKRGQADRILVLAKKSLLAQFQAELWNRFAVPLVRLDSTGLAKLQLNIPASKNPFEMYHRIIISIDTLKDIVRCSHFLEDTRWDVVVIDEAHNVAGGSNPEKHLSYRLARRLAWRTNSMLLTTATPHNGKRETFGQLISLLAPSAIPGPKLREYEASDIKPFFLMRFKEDVRADINLDLNVWVRGEKLRLARIDGPEVRGKTRAAGLSARDWLRARILVQAVTLHTVQDKAGKYGRYLAEILVDGSNVNDELVETGHAVYREY